MVALVGAGPGAPGLLTLRGRELLEKAEVVVYDRLVGQEILDLIPPHAKKINVGKAAASHLVPQEEINQILLEEGRNSLVVRLKGGDPFLFGRGGEELELLERHGLPFEVVPGVTSAVAAAAFAGIPVTHRDYCSSVHILTGHVREGGELSLDFDALVRTGGTLVFLMGVSSLEKLCSGLQEAGMAPTTPAAAVQDGTKPSQKKVISTLTDLVQAARQAKIASPAVIIIGSVCSLNSRFDWFSKLPLKGRVIVSTRPQQMAHSLCSGLRELGAQVLSFPCIQTTAIRENLPFDDALRHLERYRWLVLTSRFGAKLLFERLAQLGLDSRALAGVKLAVVGPETAKEFTNRGMLVDYLPEIYETKYLATGLSQRVAAGERVLLCRSQLGSPALTQTLRENNIAFDEIVTYKTQFCTEGAEDLRSLLEAGRVDCVTFTSGSTVEGFVKAMPGLDFSTITAACIGKPTAKTAARYGMKTRVSEQATTQSLIKLIKEGLCNGTGHSTT